MCCIVHPENGMCDHPCVCKWAFFGIPVTKVLFFTRKCFFLRHCFADWSVFLWVLGCAVQIYQYIYKLCTYVCCAYLCMSMYITHIYTHIYLHTYLRTYLHTYIYRQCSLYACVFNHFHRVIYIYTYKEVYWFMYACIIIYHLNYLYISVQISHCLCLRAPVSHLVTRSRRVTRVLPQLIIQRERERQRETKYA